MISNHTQKNKSYNAPTLRQSEHEKKKTVLEAAETTRLPWGWGPLNRESRQPCLERTKHGRIWIGR